MDKIKKNTFNGVGEKNFLLKFCLLLFNIIVVASWVFYAKWYNTLNGSIAFSTQTFPIWKLTNEKIS